MRNFVKNNIVLIVGACLPILVLILFGLATVLPAFFVEPPKYDVLFATGYFDSSNGLKFSVVNGRFEAHYHCNSFCNSNVYSLQKFYIFNVKTRTVKEMSVPPPVIMQDNKVTDQPILIPELNSLYIDTSIKSPDGYQLDLNRNDNDNMLGFLFFGSHYNSDLAMSKNGYIVVIPMSANKPLYYNLKFIGWIIPEKGIANGK